MENNENEIILYADENGRTNVSVRFADEDVWVTAVQLDEVYATTRQNIGQHLENIYKDGELPRKATIKKLFIVQKEGSRQVRREIEQVTDIYATATAYDYSTDSKTTKFFFATVQNMQRKQVRSVAHHAVHCRAESNVF